MSQVRIGFVGVGFMGQLAHLRNYVAIEGCEVVAIAEPRQETARRVAARYGVPGVYDDVQRMLAEEELDGIVAAQQYPRHVHLLPELYGRVPYVLTEKALANSVAGGERLVAAARAAGSVHMVGYQKRCDPAVEAARDAIDDLRGSGRLGALRYVRASVALGDWLLRADTSPLVDAGEPSPAAELEPAPADVPEHLAARYDDLVNFYVHQLNLLRFLLKEPYELTYVDPEGVLHVGRSASGVTVAVEGGHREQVEWDETVLVAFERGWLRLTVPPPLAWETGSLELYDGALTRPAINGLPAFRRQAEAFVAVCRGERPPPADAADALDDLRLIRSAMELAA